MNEQRQRLAERVFKELMAFPASARERELVARTQGDEALERDVRGLLAFAQEDTGPLENLVPAYAGPRVDDPDVLPSGQTVGRYTLLRVLGEGGMGVVYVAEQERPKRTVALKVIRPECSTRSMLRRFEFEAEILGKLQHPGIAHVIEAGIAETPEGGQGRPFLAMELINGSHISTYARESALSIEQRVGLFVRVCEGVEHAHQRGVIHRDLKPANIMVDRSGQPKVLDFGVARAVSANAADPGFTFVRTGHRQLIGTLAYMSPEQVGGSQQDLDTRSDVYSLGVVLFELLTGTLPHDLTDRSVPDAVRVITDVAPATPGTRVPECRGDLETIILKALEKDRARRYQSAAELASDLRRYLSHAPITARPASAMYTFRKFAARNRKFVGALVALAAALVIGFAGTFTGFIQARRERDEALRARRAAEGAAKFVLNEMIASAAPTTPDFKNITHASVVRNAARRAPARFAHDPRIRHEVLQGLGVSLFDLGDYGEALACFRGSLAAAEEAFGASTGDCVRPLLYLATTLDSMGHHAEANERRAQAVETAARELEPTDLDTLDARGEVLFMSVAYGNARDAEDELVALLGDYDRAGHFGGRTFANLNNELSNVLVRKGRRDEALALRRTLIEEYRRRKGPLHVDTLIVSLPFAEILQQCGYLEESLKVGTRTLGELLQVYDAGHDCVLHCRQAVAEIMLALDQPKEALVEIQECVKYIPTTQDDGQMKPVKYEFTMAMALCANGRAEEALPFAQRNYDVQRKYFGDSHNVALDAWFTLGRTISLIPGRAEEGLRIMREAIRQRLEKKLAVGVSRYYLGDSLSRLERLEEAIAEQTIVVEDSRKLFGDSNPFTRRMARRLADYCQRAGRADDAKRWQEFAG